MWIIFNYSSFQRDTNTISIILITVVSVILFKESLTIPKAVGIGIICFGMYLIS
jgi:multidrug transporter EmrE-like cation transporter